MSQINKKAIEQEVSQSYLDYAMSVIIGRALPDVRDGLKPVHRRILYSMYELNNTSDKPYKKSARIVGEVLGKYHPHGDASIDSSLVRMAQDFSMRYPLVDGQGNFGSIDGDNAAAMRYTEVRLEKISQELLEDIDKETVNFVPNFDGTLKEPVVLPAKIPNLLINGSSGIAVGMATNIPPHNLGEICDGIIYLIKNQNVEIEELNKIIKGPDFPTGGEISSRTRILQAYKTGKGTIIIKGTAQITERNSKKVIKISEIPFGVNKSSLVSEIATLIKEKKLEGAVDILDLSNKDGIEILVFLKKDADPNVALSNLYAKTQLQTTFGIINLALVDGQPKILNLKDMLFEFISFRREIITKRTKYLLGVAEDKKHILDGLVIALNNLDNVIEIIKKSKNSSTAKEKLVNNFSLTEKQAEAILDMKLSKLTELEQENIKKDVHELERNIKYYKDILTNKELVDQLIIQEMQDIKEKYSDERKTRISEEEEKEYDYKELIADQPIAIILTNHDYVKAIPLNEYKTQKRGGKGMIGSQTKEEDIIKDVLISRTHDTILFFTASGMVHWLDAYKIPLVGRYAFGKPVVNLLDIKEDKIAAMISLRSLTNNDYLLMATVNGIIKRTPLEEYSHPRKGGIKAIKLKDNDKLISVLKSPGNSQIMLATAKGFCIKFSEEEVREIGRVAQGVKGIELREGDRVVAMTLCDKPTILTVCENGYGKRTKTEEYRLQGRGGYGIINIKTSPRNGEVVALKAVSDENEILLLSTLNHAIRIPVSNIPVIGRNTQGVRLMKLEENEKIVALEYIDV